MGKFTTVTARNVGPKFEHGGVTVIRKGSKAGEAFESGKKEVLELPSAGKYSKSVRGKVAEEMAADDVVGVIRRSKTSPFSFRK